MDGREAVDLTLKEEIHRKDADISIKEELRCQKEGVGQVSRRIYRVT